MTNHARVETRPFPRPKDLDVGEILDMLCDTMRVELLALTHPKRDPVAMTKGLSVLRAIYRVMIDLGHEEWRPMLEHLQVELDDLGRGVQAMLIRKMSDPATSPEDVELIKQYFSGEAG
jgi:hypothetical protein